MSRYLRSGAGGDVRRNVAAIEQVPYAVLGELDAGAPADLHNRPIVDTDRQVIDPLGELDRRGPLAGDRHVDDPVRAPQVSDALGPFGQRAVLAARNCRRCVW